MTNPDEQDSDEINFDDLGIDGQDADGQDAGEQNANGANNPPAQNVNNPRTRRAAADGGLLTYFSSPAKAIRFFQRRPEFANRITLANGESGVDAVNEESIRQVTITHDDGSTRTYRQIVADDKNASWLEIDPNTGEPVRDANGQCHVVFSYGGYNGNQSELIQIITDRFLGSDDINGPPTNPEGMAIWKMVHGDLNPELEGSNVQNLVDSTLAELGAQNINADQISSDHLGYCMGGTGAVASRYYSAQLGIDSEAVLLAPFQTAGQTRLLAQRLGVSEAELVENTSSIIPGRNGHLDPFMGTMMRTVMGENYGGVGRLLIANTGESNHGMIMDTFEDHGAFMMSASAANDGIADMQKPNDDVSGMQKVNQMPIPSAERMALASILSLLAGEDMTQLISSPIVEPGIGGLSFSGNVGNQQNLRLPSQQFPVILDPSMLNR
jgi:hypothetical protein